MGVGGRDRAKGGNGGEGKREQRGGEEAGVNWKSIKSRYVFRK